MIDSIGPLPVNSEGFEHIMVVIDCFSRYVDLLPLKTISAVETARKLIEHIGRNGCPEIIQWDRGTQFVNDLISEVITIVGTQSQMILAHSKEEKGQ